MVALCVLGAVACMTIANLSGPVFPSVWFMVFGYLAIGFILMVFALILTKRG